MTRHTQMTRHTLTRRAAPRVQGQRSGRAYDPLLVLVALAQALLGAVYVVSLGWHRPSLATPLLPILAGVAVATFAVVLATLYVARWFGGTELVILVACVDLLVLVGFLLRLSVQATTASSVGLLLAGLVVMFLAMRVGAELTWTPKLAWLCRAVVVGCGVWLFRAEEVNGARVNVVVGPVQFQLAEVLVAGLLGLVAARFAKRRNIPPVRRVAGAGIPNLQTLGRLTIPVLFGIAMFVVVKDLGPAILLLAGFIGILVYRTREWFYAVIAAALFVLGLLVVPRLPLGRFSHVDARIDQWLHPFADDTVSQTGKALLTLARGGLTGVGPGADRARSIGDQYTNDYILAVVGEQLGLVGLLLVLAVAAGVVVQLGRFAARCPDNFLQTWSIGLTVALAAHFALPALAAGRLAPVVGVTTPMLSSGASSMFVVFATIGIVAGGAASASAHASAASAASPADAGYPSGYPARSPGRSTGRSTGRLGGARPAPAAGARNNPDGHRRPDHILRAPREAHLPGSPTGRRGHGIPHLPRAPQVSLAIAAVMVVGICVVQVGNRDAILAHDPGEHVKWLTNSSPDRGRLLADDGRTVLAETGTVTQSGELLDGRVYPAGAAAAAPTGYFVPRLDIGIGVEREWSRWLECGPPSDGTAEEMFGARCQPTDLRLTVDPAVQEAAANALGTRHGAVVAIDPSTGGILAAVTRPGYDPNDIVNPGGRSPAAVAAALGERDAARRQSQSTYLPAQPGVEGSATLLATQPGSVFKLVVAAAGSPSELAEPVPVTDALTYRSDRPPLRNVVGMSCGGSLRDIIKVSCNTGVAQLAQRLGPTRIADTARKLGFSAGGTGGAGASVDGMPVGISHVPDPREPPDPKCGQVDVELTAIGQQCVRATPLQMATVAATIANGGKKPDIHLVTQAERNGEPVEVLPRDDAREVMPEQTAHLVTEGMVATVAEDGGTADTVRIPGYTVAAKTSSVQSSPCNTEQTEFSVNAWMVAFAPVEKPTVAVAVFLEALPSACEKLVGGTDAGPVARMVLEKALER